jgi:pilus assembly protein Flp/PilA
MQMKQFHQKWRAFHADQSGQDTIEYALVVAVIGLGAIASLRGLATSIGNFWYAFLQKMAPIWPS